MSGKWMLLSRLPVRFILDWKLSSALALLFFVTVTPALGATGLIPGSLAIDIAPLCVLPALAGLYLTAEVRVDFLQSEVPS